MADRKTTLLMASVGLGTYMSSLDSSAVNLVIPKIQEHFHVPVSGVEWIITAYLLIISSLLLTFGRLADLYGHKKVYLSGFVLFVAGSLFCGLSFNLPLLIAARILQALGAGMLFSTGPAIITNAVPPEKRGRALSITAIAVALGTSTGPVIGGALANFFGWQSIFFINIPLGILGISMVVKNLPPDEKKEAQAFDLLGSGLVFLALLCILLPLNLSSAHAISSLIFFALLAAGFLILALFIWHESRCKSPMLDLSLFKNRVFAASNAAALLMYGSEFIMIFLVPFYLQNLRSYSTLLSGLLYLPLPLATLCIAPISGNISDRFDSRYISSLGALILAAGLGLMSFFTADTSQGYIIVSLMAVGLGFGMFQTPNNSSIMGNVPAKNRGTASGTLATMRNIGMALGVASSGALFSLFQKLFTDPARTETLGLNAENLNADTFIPALRATFLFAAGVALLAMIASFSKGKVATEKEKSAQIKPVS